MVIIEERKHRHDLIELLKMSQGKSLIGLQDLFTLEKSNQNKR